MAVNPLQPSEILAYFQLIGEQPTPWDVRTLLRMDAAFLAKLSKPKNATQGLTVDINDAKGVSALMRSLAAKTKKRSGMKKVEVRPNGG